jgi:predicted metal-binding protein/predicted GNAT family acetyltransferase
MENRPIIIHQADIPAEDAKLTAVQVAQNVFKVTSIYVAESLRDRGIAAMLCENFCSYLKTTGAKTVLQCPYAIDWFTKNRDRKDVLAVLKFGEYIDLACEKGALHAVAVTTDELAFDPRTLLKCMFGCDSWGRDHTCPSRPGSLKPWEYEQILRRYRYVMIIHAHDKRTTQSASFAVESKAFTDGDAFAFSMSDCALCERCKGKDGAPCVNPKKARPAFHSVGIDVFTTVKRLGLPIHTLSSADEEQNWYAAVFLD